MSLLYTPFKRVYCSEIFLYRKIQTFCLCIIKFQLLRLTWIVAKRFFYYVNVNGLNILDPRRCDGKVEKACCGEGSESLELKTIIF